jgi:hypothetical protein
MTEVALLNDRDQGVDISRIVRAGGKTVFTADTAMLIDDDDPVFPLPGSLYRAIDHAGRVVTLIAEAGKEVACRVRVFSLFNYLHPGAIHS